MQVLTLSGKASQVFKYLALLSKYNNKTLEELKHETQS
jgi:hypothetical protein